LLFQQGDVYAALPYLRRAVALRPDWPVALGNLGNALMAVGQSQEGLSKLRAAVEASPNSATSHVWLAAALDYVGQWDAARESYAAALAIDPANPWATSGLARLDAAHPKAD
jgi:tetratricopeptide (TPR) repeat protein